MVEVRNQRIRSLETGQKQSWACNCKYTRSTGQLIDNLLKASTDSELGCALNRLFKTIGNAGCACALVHAL